MFSHPGNKVSTGECFDYMYIKTYQLKIKIYRNMQFECLITEFSLLVLMVFWHRSFQAVIQRKCGYILGPCQLSKSWNGGKKK